MCGTKEYRERNFRPMNEARQRHVVCPESENLAFTGCSLLNVGQTLRAIPGKGGNTRAAGLRTWGPITEDALGWVDAQRHKALGVQHRQLHHLPHPLYLLLAPACIRREHKQPQFCWAL